MVFVVLGGGCYGTFYARQLLRAAEAGAISQPDIVIVDRNERPAAAALAHHSCVRLVWRDWDAFLDSYLGRLNQRADDQIVPPPFTPHLAVGWLLRTLRLRRPDVFWDTEPFAKLPGTPFQRQAENGTLAVSHADWICPVHCIEPAVCPKTRGPRFWDMAETARTYVSALTAAGQPIDQVHLLQCLHLTHGVGTYPATRLLAALEQLERLEPLAGQAVRAVIGTVSRCHGAMHLLRGRAGTDTVSRSGTRAVAEGEGLLHD